MTIFFFILTMLALAICAVAVYKPHLLWSVMLLRAAIEDSNEAFYHLEWMKQNSFMDRRSLDSDIHALPIIQEVGEDSRLSKTWQATCRSISDLYSSYFTKEARLAKPSSGTNVERARRSLDRIYTGDVRRMADERIRECSYGQESSQDESNSGKVFIICDFRHTKMVQEQEAECISSFQSAQKRQKALQAVQLEREKQSPVCLAVS